MTMNICASVNGSNTYNANDFKQTFVVNWIFTSVWRWFQQLENIL